MSSRRLNLSVQYVCNKTELPLRAQIRCWARAALPGGRQVAIRFVDHQEGQLLNRDYRGKDYATNVLTFPYASAPILCGDLVLCAPVVEREAGEQGKSAEAHYAHLIVHGLLHLQGHDHESRKEARQMENHERAILAELGYADPYAGEK